MRSLCQKAPKSRTGRILGYVAQIRILKAPSPPAKPRFCGFQALESSNETPRPMYHWSLGGAGGQHGPRAVGANRVPGAKKQVFSKVVPRPLGMLKQVFLARFETVVARFGPWKISKCLENGPFRDKKWVKNVFFQQRSWTNWGALGPKTAHFQGILGFSVAQNTSPWAQNGLKTVVCAPPNGLGLPLEKRVVEPLSDPFLVPKQPIFKAFWDFPWPKTRHHGLKMG